MLERSHLDSYIHPCLEAALWHIAKINYEFGEIPSKYHTKRDLADGVGYMTGPDKYQLVYVEGPKPVAKDDKEISDSDKIGKNLKKIYTSIIKEGISNLRRLPGEFAIFGGQSFQLRVHLSYVDYCGMLF